MIFVLLGIAIVYVLAISWLIYGFTKVPVYTKKEVTPKTTFSILVPFRNEAENLPILLESIAKLKYPKDLFEVLLIDDASEEKFQIPNSKFQITLTNSIRQSNSPKKDAITTGIPLANNEWIVTTDADCVIPKNWLLTMDAFIQNHTVEMIAGAVTYDCKPSFLHHFQQLDLTSLQGATIGSFGLNKGFMCNGANFAYTKSIFEKLNGFEGNDKIASGDDVFLLQKAIEKFLDEVHYLKAKEVIVSTKPTETWKSLFYQRVRWAAKTSSYKSSFGKLLGLIVFFGNLSFVIGFFYFLLGFWSYSVFVLVAFLKFLIDFVLLYATNKFLSKNRIKSLLLSSLFYPFFSSTVALYSLFGSYEWKDRRFRS